MAAIDERDGLLATPLAPAGQPVGGALKLTPREARTLGIAAVLFVLAATVPFYASGYYMTVSVSLAMFTVLATSWTLFSGPTHYISLATAAFFGIGMYTVAIGLGKFPYPVLVAFAGVLGAVFAAFVGLATLRVSGVYFVVFTLGLAELVRQIITWMQSVMGASSGLYVLIDMPDERLYWLLLVLAAIVFLIGWWIGRSRLGFALRVIGNDETVAVHSGINTARAKVGLFVISSTFAAVTGALVAPRWSYVEPTLAFSPFLSFQVVIMSLLGGIHRLWGPLLGVFPFTILWEVIASNFPAQTTLLLGVCFLLIVYLIPNGFVGLAEDLWRRWRNSRA